MQGHGVADEVLGAGLEAKLVVDVLHGRVVEGEALVGGRVFGLVVLNKLKEALGASLLKQAHEGGLDGLHLGGRHFGDAAVSEDVRSRDLFELHVARDVGVDEHAGEFAVGHHELGDEVHGDCVPMVASVNPLGFFG